MKTVWKYKLDIADHQTIMIPAKAEILSIKEQCEEIVLYALVDPKVKGVDAIDILIIGTGHEIDDEQIKGYVFLDTVKLFQGRLMFHVFYKRQ